MPAAIILKHQGRKFIEKQTSLLWKEHGGSCANLVQYFGCGHTSNWTPGAIVKGNLGIEKGTCIATFLDGKYPNKPSGNSCAVYISQDGKGIEAYHQARAWKEPIIDYFPFKDDMSDPSFNGNCYSVILSSVPYKRAPGYKYVKLASNPATTPDSARVLKVVISQRHDKSVRKALKKALEDEVLTFDDVEAIIKSTQDRSKSGKLYNHYELRALKIILNRAQTLDDKCRKRLKQFLLYNSGR